MNKQAYFKLMGISSMLKQAAEQQEEDKETKKKKKEQEKQQKKDNREASKSTRRRHGKWHSEVLGPGTNLVGLGLGGGALGALIGALQGKDNLDRLGGAIAGGITGAGIGAGTSALGNLIGGISGAIAGPRTLADQNAYNSSTGSTVANWLLPGAGTYNFIRSKATKDEQDAVLQEILLKQKLKAAGLT